MLGISGNAKDPTQNRSFTGDLSRMSGASSQMSGMGSNMMRSIARLWCHESTRVFGDRILMSEGELIQFFSNSIYYCPLTKLREGNVFTGVCQSFCPHRGGGYAWSQVPSGGGLVGMPGSRSLLGWVCLVPGGGVCMVPGPLGGCIFGVGGFARFTSEGTPPGRCTILPLWKEGTPFLKVHPGY